MPGVSARKHKMVGIALILVVAAAIYLAFTAINGVPAYPYHYATANFATASNVVSHDDVRVNGARIGQVSNITFDAKTNLTQVKMQLQPGHTLYRNATASVGAISALGSEYITLDPGTKSAGPLPTGGIPLSQTTTPVEIDSILNILGPKQASAAAASVQTLGAGFGGQGPDLNTILSTAPKLLPNIGTTAATLSDNQSDLVGLIQDSNLLSSRFQGRTQQLAELLGEMNTTFAALDTKNGSSLKDTIDDAASTLPVLNPALNDLGAVAGKTANAVDAVKPGLAALGTGTPDLRTLLVQGVSPLDKVPAVANQAVPGVEKLTTTFQTGDTSQPVFNFIAQLEQSAQPLASYMAPYTVDMDSLWATLADLLSSGDQNGNWLPFSLTYDYRTVTGKAPGLTNPPLGIPVGRCSYPAPNTSMKITATNTLGCTK